MEWLHQKTSKITTFFLFCICIDIYPASSHLKKLTEGTKSHHQSVSLWSMCLWLNKMMLVKMIVNLTNLDQIIKSSSDSPAVLFVFQICYTKFSKETNPTMTKTFKSAKSRKSSGISRMKQTVIFSSWLHAMWRFLYSMRKLFKSLLKCKPLI